MACFNYYYMVHFKPYMSPTSYNNLAIILVVNWISEINMATNTTLAPSNRCPITIATTYRRKSKIYLIFCLWHFGTSRCTIWLNVVPRNTVQVIECLLLTELPNLIYKLKISLISMWLWKKVINSSVAGCVIAAIAARETWTDTSAINVARSQVCMPTVSLLCQVQNFSHIGICTSAKSKSHSNLMYLIINLIQFLGLLTAANQAEKEI